MIQLDSSILHDVGAASQLEWLETNGLGGFAMSTPIGMNTRKYHGLLVAATRPPAGRHLLLAKLEGLLSLRPDGETGDEQKFELSSNQYPGIVFRTATRCKHLSGWILFPRLRSTAQA